MPVAEKIIVNDGIVGLYKMTETWEELEQKYIGLFCEEPPFVCFQHGRRRKEWLAVRILIAELIGLDFSISYAETGKPQFSNNDYRFISISHSATYAAVYLHENKKVGLDVESLNRKFLFVEKKYLSEIELAHVKESSLLHAIYWSCKEAVFKWAGMVGVDFRTQIRIEKFDVNQTNIINAIFLNLEEQSIKLNFLIFDGHVLVYTV